MVDDDGLEGVVALFILQLREGGGTQQWRKLTWKREWGKEEKEKRSFTTSTHGKKKMDNENQNELNMRFIQVKKSTSY